jgi:hypothetical protein
MSNIGSTLVHHRAYSLDDRASKCSHLVSNYSLIGSQSLVCMLCRYANNLLRYMRDSYSRGAQNIEHNLSDMAHMSLTNYLDTNQCKGTHYNLQLHCYGDM